MIVTERPDAYSQRTSSCGTPYLNEAKSGMGSSCGTGVFARNRQIVYDHEAARRMAMSLRAYTGGGPVFECWVVEKNVHTHAERRAPDADILSLQGMIQAIRGAFGLSVTQLAIVMKVERVTVYDWMRKDSMDMLRPISRERMKVLSEVAKVWNQYPPLFGKFLYEPLPDGKCVIDLLSEVLLNDAQILKAYDDLALKKNSAQRAKDQRSTQLKINREVGSNLRSAFARLDARPKEQF